MAILRKLGYEADVAADGKEAVRALKQVDYDAVLLDCAMPEMDGYETTHCVREGRAGGRNLNIPIIAMTADAMTGDRDKCLQAGMNDYLAKPVDPKQLAEVLQKWLSRTGLDMHLPTSQSTKETSSVFDPETLLARLMGDKKLAAKLLAGFLEDAPRQLSALKSRLEAGDAEGARLLAHTLKGAAATVSAAALQALCRDLQEAASSGELSRAMVLLPQLEEQLGRLKDAIKQSTWM